MYETWKKNKKQHKYSIKSNNNRTAAVHNLIEIIAIATEIRRSWKKMFDKESQRIGGFSKPI